LDALVENIILAEKEKDDQEDINLRVICLSLDAFIHHSENREIL